MFHAFVHKLSTAELLICIYIGMYASTVFMLLLHCSKAYCRMGVANYSTKF